MRNRDSRMINVSIGLLISLSTIFVAFEWSSTAYTPTRVIDNSTYTISEEDMIPVPILRAKPVRSVIPIPKMPNLAKLEVVENFDPIPDDELEISETMEVADLSYLDQDEIVVEEDAPFVLVEDMPRFPGGENALLAFLQNEISYPLGALENGAQGKVFVQFVVERDGSISEIEIVKGPDEFLNKESLRVVNRMPKWTPGKQNGKAVRVRMSLPVNFVLN